MASPDARAMRELSRRWLFAILAGLAACRGSTSTPPRIEGRTEVVILATIHGAHLRSEGYSLAVLEGIVSRVDPDVVLVEIPPARFDKALQEVDELGEQASAETIDDPWLRAFPELYKVVLPQRDELGYEVVPVSGWTPEVSKDRKAYRAEHPQGPREPDSSATRSAFKAAAAKHRANENPRWLNGPEYLELSGRAERAKSNAADHELGQAGVEAINAAHFRLVARAIEEHRGRRILLVYGALHRWYMQPRIEAMQGVTLLDVRRFFP